jgi:ribonuclease HII
LDEAIRIGIDENGLGPRLGPLVVTAVEAVTAGAGHARAESRPRGALRERLDDSKKLVAYGDTALGEAWARAIARRMGCPGPAGHAGPATPEALLRAISLDSADALRAPCPGDHRAQCWSEGGEAFTCDPALLAKVEKDLDRLASQGIDVKRATCVVTCARRLNDGVARGLTRFHLDLHAMERLALDARARAGRNVLATCGKVGGFDRYEPAFGPMSGHLRAVEVEGRARSVYVFPGVGRLAFVRDADAKHMLVSMASLVGKWVRDLLMNRIVRHYRATTGDPELPDASGYHDPVTTRFIEATRLARSRRDVPDDCFVRRALEPGASARGRLAT